MATAAKNQRLIDRLTAAKGWSVQEKYPYDIKDSAGDVIETVFIKPLSRAQHKKIADIETDTSRLATRFLVESAYLADGEKAFEVADIATLMREVSATQLNDLEMAVLNAGRSLNVEAEKKDLAKTD